MTLASLPSNILCDSKGFDIELCPRGSSRWLAGPVNATVPVLSLPEHLRYAAALPSKGLHGTCLRSEFDRGAFAY